jgi:hypothetical protein
MRHVRLLTVSVGTLTLASSAFLGGGLADLREIRSGMSAAADCDQLFIPALDPSDRFTGLNGAPLQWAGIGLSFLPRETAYNYRPLRVNASDVETLEGYAAPDLLGLERPADGRVDMYVGEHSALTVISARVASGSCGRLVLKLDPPALQVAIPAASGTATTGSFWEAHVAPVLRCTENPNAAACARDRLAQAAIPAGTGRLTAKVYIDGKPAPNQVVTLTTHPLARAPRGLGRTIAHDHIAQDPAGHPPTIRIDRNRVTTDSNGEAVVNVTAGDRGGVEGIRAEFTLRGTRFVGERAVVVRHMRIFEHFVEAAGYWGGRAPAASTEFPFMMVGHTRQHSNAHWLQQGASGVAVRQLKMVWAGDERRTAHRDGEKMFIALNDMSLEYGGVFHVTTSAYPNRKCTLAEGYGAGHGGHNTGLEIDMNPCYQVAGKGYIDGPSCYDGTGLRVNERRLAAYIVGYGGRILVHGRSSFHYHIRLPIVNPGETRVAP